MLPEKQLSFPEFMTSLENLPVSPLFRFAKGKSWSQDNHDRIFLVCSQGPNRGAHLGRTCLCCNDNSSINDYDGFEDSMSEEQYNAILELLYNFTYTDVGYKAFK